MRKLQQIIGPGIAITQKFAESANILPLKNDPELFDICPTQIPIF